MELELVILNKIFYLLWQNFGFSCVCSNFFFFCIFGLVHVVTPHYHFTLVLYKIKNICCCIRERERERESSVSKHFHMFSIYILFSYCTIWFSKRTCLEKLLHILYRKIIAIYCKISNYTKRCAGIMRGKWRSFVKLKNMFHRKVQIRISRWKMFLSLSLCNLCFYFENQQNFLLNFFCLVFFSVKFIFEFIQHHFMRYIFVVKIKYKFLV